MVLNLSCCAIEGAAVHGAKFVMLCFRLHCLCVSVEMMSRQSVLEHFENMQSSTSSKWTASCPGLAAPLVAPGRAFDQNFSSSSERVSCTWARLNFWMEEHTALWSIFSDCTITVATLHKNCSLLILCMIPKSQFAVTFVCAVCVVQILILLLWCCWFGFRNGVEKN